MKMSRRASGPTINKQTGHYFVDEIVGFFPDSRRFRYSLRTKDKEIAKELWKLEYRKLWTHYYRLTLPEISPKEPCVEWHIYHPHKKPRSRMSKEEKINEMKKKISIKNSGKYHPQWRGGISLEPYGPEFNDILKEKVRKRDNYTCIFCSNAEDGSAHAVHHVDYNKKNNRQKNLITLCKKCHGLTTKDRAAWMAFYSVLCETRSKPKRFSIAKF